jgi:hypothetical protein
MSSLSARAGDPARYALPARALRRVPFAPIVGASPVPRSLDGENLSSGLSKIEIKRAIRTYVSEHSTLPALLGCATIYLPRQRTWNACGHPLCWSCARKRAEDLSADLRRRSESYAFVYSLRLSVQSTPSASLSASWRLLDDLRRPLARGRWLTGRVAAFRWFTEITRGPGGWHPHLNLIVVSRNEIDPSEIPARWEALAASEGVFAPADAQYVERITRTPGRAFRYATKGPLAIHGDSRTAGAILLDAALHGDADAATDWQEIETASAGRRWQGTGGEWRERRA